MEDEQIIELYFRRDQDAIVQTELAHGAKLNALANRILMNHEDAQECVSDTYMKAWETIPPTRPTYLYAYLAKICRFLSFQPVNGTDCIRSNYNCFLLQFGF